MHVTCPHRFSPIREDTDDGLQHPVLPAVPEPDRRARPRGAAAVRANFGTGTLDAIIPAPFQQGFQGARRVGMVPG
jgi:hypothetical protein